MSETNAANHGEYRHGASGSVELSNAKYAAKIQMRRALISQPNDGPTAARHCLPVEGTTRIEDFGLPHHNL